MGSIPCNKVDGQSEESHDAEQMGPNISCLCVNPKYRLKALPAKDLELVTAASLPNQQSDKNKKRPTIRP